MHVIPRPMPVIPRPMPVIPRPMHVIPAQAGIPVRVRFAATRLLSIEQIKFPAILP
jgi:hypothetical protein